MDVQINNNQKKMLHALLNGVLLNPDCQIYFRMSRGGTTYVLNVFERLVKNCSEQELRNLMLSLEK